MHPVTLSDGTITLRPWTAEDAPVVHRMVQDPEVPRYMGIPPNQTLEGTQKWLSGRDAGWAAGNDLALAVTSAETGALLGSVGLELSADDPAIAEIGYWVAAEARGKGVARRAVALVAEWAFGCLGLARLEITTHLDNLRSQHVAEANGFEREGVLRSYREHHDKRVDLVMYSKLRRDHE